MTEGFSFKWTLFYSALESELLASKRNASTHRKVNLVLFIDIIISSKTTLKLHVHSQTQRSARIPIASMRWFNFNVCHKQLAVSQENCSQNVLPRSVWRFSISPVSEHNLKARKKILWLQWQLCVLRFCSGIRPKPQFSCLPLRHICFTPTQVFIQTKILTSGGILTTQLILLSFKTKKNTQQIL